MKKISLFIRNNRVLIIITLLGLLIRLLLMPITAHCDLLSSAWRQSLYIFKGDFRISQFSELFSLPYLFLIKPLIIRLPEALNLAEQRNISILQPGFELFVQHPRAMRYIFLLKVPYLFFDFIILFIGAKFFNTYRQKIYFYLIWALNPLVLYSVYAWGRYEVVPILFVFLSLFLLKKKYKYWAILLLGFALISRLSLLIIVPFFIIYSSKTIKDYILNIFLVLLPAIIFNSITVSSGSSNIISSASSADYGRMMFHMQLGIGYTAVSLFVIAYPVLVYLFYKKYNRDIDDLMIWSFIGLSAYFIFGYFNPHYPAWLSIFFLLLLPKYPKRIWLLFLFAIFYLVFIESYYGTGVTWLMLLPLNFNFFQSIAKLSDQSVFLNYDPVTFRIIFRSLFDLVLLSFSYFFVYEKHSKKEA